MSMSSHTTTEAPAVLRYGLGLLAVAAALGVRIVIEPIAGTKWPFILFALAVVVAARFGGYGPGLVATGASTLAIWYFLLDPPYSFAIADRSEIGGIVVFTIVGAGISLLNGQLHSTLAALRGEIQQREQTAARLAETESRTTAILETISDGFNIFDHEWRYTYVNTAGARLVGKTREELLGRTLWEMWPNVYGSPFGIAYRRSVEENIPLVVEAFYATLNAWFEVRCYPAPEGLLLFFTDVSDRKRAAETARLLSSIVESSEDAILSKNHDGIVLSWNQGAERIYGYSAEEMIGQCVSILSPDRSRDDYMAIIGELGQGRRVSYHEAERVRKDGRRVFVSLTVSALRNDAGELTGASVMARDITEQKRSREALRLSEERYRSLVSATEQMVWTTNARGEVVEDIPAWRALTGQTLEQMLGSGWADAIHPRDRTRNDADWACAVRSKVPYHAEYRVRRHDGQYRYMAVHGVPVLESDGSVREWIGTIGDITDARVAEEEVRRLHADLEKRVTTRTAELKAANDELEAFAYSVSHDLRAPLRAVDGFSRILLEEFAPQLPAEAVHYLEVARRNAMQMGELIDGLLAFSRMGRQPVRKQTVMPADLARQAWQSLSADWEGRAVEMIVADLPSCEADPFLLQQVFANLLSNALKYTRMRSPARIEVGWQRRADDGETVYMVRDNGVGFDMRYADKLFGVFQRLHRAEEYEGTGIGLANVQRVIDKHGGSVWAQAEEDRGATFYFTLPGAGAIAETAVEEQEQLQS